MSKSKHQRTARRNGRPRIGDRQPGSGSPVVAPASLPLPDAGQTPSAPLPAKRPLAPEDSPIRETAIKIYLMRGAGMDEATIAEHLGLSVKTLSGYIYKAGRMGWLNDFIVDHKARLQDVIMHKVLDNIQEGLEDEERNEKTGMKVKTTVALKVAEGALFPSMQQPGQGGGNTMLMGIKIEVVGNEPGKIREGTIVEAPAYRVEDAE